MMLPSIAGAPVPVQAEAPALTPGAFPSRPDTSWPPLPMDCAMEDDPLTRDEVLVELAAVRRQAAQLDAELRRAQETVLATLESIPDGFMVLDCGGRIRFVNKRFEQLAPNPRS